MMQPDINLVDKYKFKLSELFVDLVKNKKYELNSDGKITYNNNDLWRMFEYYTCIKLSEEYSRPFYMYSDIPNDFKEANKMSRIDTGIDCCDMVDTIVQCKLRCESITLHDCSTFFTAQNSWDETTREVKVKWKNLIVSRNINSKFSTNFVDKRRFIDKPYSIDDMLKYCEGLSGQLIQLPKIQQTPFVLRDYQKECIELIKTSGKNLIINLPTGTGKNSVISYSIDLANKYLILVPRIILMEQLKTELIKCSDKFEKQIQFIGGSYGLFEPSIQITICVYNSIEIIEPYAHTFHKIFIDEAHHIARPDIYSTDSDDTDTESIGEVLDIQIGKPIEDEMDNFDKYTAKIRKFTKYNNNVYLSATIDQIEGFGYYTKDIRTMINSGYLCDYTIHVPIFSSDPDNLRVCTHLVQNYRNIIVYCLSQKEGKEITKILNGLNKDSAYYIDCKTPRKSRDKIIREYKQGKILYLVNVRLLVEGFDAPITNGVCFMHLPENKISLVQIVGRALRTYPTKINADIILPCSSNSDETMISNFLRVMAQTDYKLKKTYETKNTNYRILLESEADKIVEANTEAKKDIEFKYNLICNNMGILTSRSDKWTEQLNELKKFVDEFNKLPDEQNNNELFDWVNTQVKHVKENIMKHNRYTQWVQFIQNPKYLIYFQLANECHMDCHENRKIPCNPEEHKKYLDNQKTCIVCFHKFANISALKTHIANNICAERTGNNNEEKTTGPLSESHTESDDELEHKISLVELRDMNKKYICSICFRKFNTNWELERHLNKKFPCKPSTKLSTEQIKELNALNNNELINFVASRTTELKIGINLLSTRGIDLPEIQNNVIDVINRTSVNSLNNPVAPDPDPEPNTENAPGMTAQPITNSSTISNSIDNSQPATNNGSIDNSINPTLKATNNGTVDNSMDNCNNINNTVNNTQNNTQNNQNQNVQLVAYGKEDISWIPNSVFIPMLGKGYLSVPELVEYIHFNKSRPENNNIFISNMRSSKINMYNGTKWVIDEIKNVVPDLIDDKKNILKDKYDELHEQLTEPAKKKFMRFYEDDTSGASKELNSRTVNMLYNSKDVPEDTIKKIKVLGKRQLIKQFD